MENEKSRLLVIIFWLSTLCCFGFGYYNTVEAFRTYDAFGINNPLGNWFIAFIPLALVFGGYCASIRGRKMWLYLYLVGEIIFFAANLTYLYPQKLGRILVNEETQMLKDSVTQYKEKLDKITGNLNPQSHQKLTTLKQIQKNLLTEIKDRKGFGPRAIKALNDFNLITGSCYTPEPYVGTSKDDWNELYDRWKKNTDTEIKEFLIKLNNKDKYAETLVEAKCQMDSIADNYNKRLDTYLANNSKLIIEERAIAHNAQILMLEELAGKLDKVASDVNSVKQPALFNKIIDTNKAIAFPKTKKLGDIDFAFVSVFDRINKLDTWIVIILCLFFDLLGPFLFYFYLRVDPPEPEQKKEPTILIKKPIKEI